MLDDSRTLPAGSIVLAVLAAVSLAVAAAAMNDRAEASHTGSMDAMSVDMDPGGFPANSGTTIGSRESCARVNENDTLDADEESIDALQIDVTAENIPASDPAIATTFRLSFPTPNVTVSQIAIPFADDNAWTALNIIDSPQVDGLFRHDVVDIDSSGSDGSGAISRLILETGVGDFTGTFDLTLGLAAHVDTTGLAHLPENVNNAIVAIDAPCPGATPTPLGETRTPVPTPTPLPYPGAGNGDIDCDGDIDAVDTQKLMRHFSGLPSSQSEGCPAIGYEGAHVFGDVNCDGGIDGVDVISVAYYVVEFEMPQQEPCPDLTGSLGSSSPGPCLGNCPRIWVDTAGFVPSGDSTVVKVVAESPPSGLGSWTVEVEWDPTWIRPVNRSFCQSESSDVDVCSSTGSGSGVRIVGVEDVGLAGENAIASFRVRASGPVGHCSSLVLTVATFADADGEDQPFRTSGGSICVGPSATSTATSTPTPTPTSILMFARVSSETLTSSPAPAWGLVTTSAPIETEAPASVQIVSAATPSATAGTVLGAPSATAPSPLGASQLPVSFPLSGASSGGTNPAAGWTLILAGVAFSIGCALFAVRSRRTR